MLYEKALESVDSGKDVDLGFIQVCEVCGYTLEGEAPDRCPVCNALKEKFTAFE
jgi:rubrerythrin